MVVGARRRAAPPPWKLAVHPRRGGTRRRSRLHSVGRAVVVAKASAVPAVGVARVASRALGALDAMPVARTGRSVGSLLTIRSQFRLSSLRAPGDIVVRRYSPADACC